MFGGKHQFHHIAAQPRKYNTMIDLLPIEIFCRFGIENRLSIGSKEYFHGKDQILLI